MWSKVYCFVLMGVLSQQCQADYITVEELVKNKAETVETLNNTAQEAWKTILDNLLSFEAKATKLSEEPIKESLLQVYNKILELKQELVTDETGLEGHQVSRCLVEEAELDSLYEEITERIESCTTTVAAEIINVVSDSANYAQVFMTIPQALGKDIQNCQLDNKCLETITWDSIQASLQTPPRVAEISNKIQELNLRTVKSIDQCLLGSIHRITGMALDILFDVIHCVHETLDEVDEEDKLA